MCEKKKVMLEYTKLHTPQLNGYNERIFEVITEMSLSMLLNAKLNGTGQKILWVESVHTCELVHNSMENTGSTKSPSEILYGEKQKTIGLFSEFGSIKYVTKRKNIKKHGGKDIQGHYRWVHR